MSLYMYQYILYTYTFFGNRFKIVHHFIIYLYLIILGDILSAYNSLTNLTVESITKFLLEWFDSPGSDLMQWEPPDWTERYNKHSWCSSLLHSLPSILPFYPSLL